MATAKPDSWTKLDTVEVERPSSTPQPVASQEQVDNEEARKLAEARLAMQREAALRSRDQGQESSVPPSLQSDEEEFVVNTEEPVEEGHQRIGLPSNFIPYSEKSITIRHLTVEEMIDVNSARTIGDTKWFRDIIDNTISMKLRDLIWADYNYILTWHRLFSYTQFPFEVKVTSVYGNECSPKIKSLFTEKSLKLEDGFYEKCLARGISIPTLATLEEGEDYSFKDAREATRWDKARYLKGNSVRSKLNAISKLTVEDLSLIRTLEDALDSSGIFQWASFRDTSIKTTAKARKEYIARLTETIENFDDHQDLIREQLGGLRFMRAKERRDLCVEAKERLSKGEAEPVLETIHIAIDELTFLPAV